MLLTMNSVTVVTAYYPLKKSKHTHEEYMEWIETFFRVVTVPIVCFCPRFVMTSLSRLSRRHPHVHYITRELHEFSLTSPKWKEFWEQQYHLDPEKAVHSPELYMVWALKQEFVKHAIKQDVFKTDYFLWCDIGYFRDKRLTLSFPNELYRYAKQNWFLCLQVIGSFPDRMMLPINKEYGIQHNTLIGGGILVGDKLGWMVFSRAYIETLHDFKQKNLFAGKDQLVYMAAITSGRLKEVNVEVAITNGTMIPSSLDWFELAKTLCIPGMYPIQSGVYNVTPTLEIACKGRLGNQLFQIASLLGLSKKYGRVPLLNSCPDLPILKEALQGLTQQTTPYILEFGTGYVCNSGMTVRGHYANEHIRLTSYLQNPDYFRNIRDDLQQWLIPADRIVNENTVLIHIRRTDYQSLKDLYEYNDVCYYTRAIQHMRMKYPGCKFHVMSDDIDEVSIYSYLQSEDITFINETDLEPWQVLQRMMMYDKYILANSTFSWWAAWLCGTDVVAPLDWFMFESSKCPTFWGVLYESNWTVVSNRPFTIHTDLLDLSWLNYEGPEWHLVANPPSERVSESMTVWYITEDIDMVLSSPKPSTIDYIVLKEPFSIKYLHPSWNQCPPAWVGDIQTPSGFHRLQTTLFTLASRPDVSILLPVYNTGIEYLLGSLASVYSQTYRSWEILLGDDGSTNTELLNLYQRIAGPRLLWIRCRQNYKLPATLNRLILSARTNRLARMDSDDVMFPTRLEKQCRFMDTHPHVNICGSQLYHVSDANGLNAISLAKAPAEITIYTVNRKDNILFHPCVMYLRSFLLTVGLYNESELHVEDLELWLRILNKGYTINNIEEPLLFYTFHDSNICVVHSDTQKIRTDQLWEMIETIQKKIQTPKLESTLSKFERHMMLTVPGRVQHPLLSGSTLNTQQRQVVEAHNQRIHSVLTAKEQSGLKFLI